MKWAGHHVFKVRKSPNRTDEQHTVVNGKVYREWLVQPKCIIMDAKQIRLDVPEEEGRQICQEVLVVVGDVCVRHGVLY